MAPAISSPRERSPRRAQHLRFERSIGSSWRGIPIQKSFLRFLDARVSSRHNDLYHGINTWKGWQPTASNDGTRRFVRLTSHLGPYPTTGRQWLSSSASKALKQIHHPEIGTGRGTSTNSCRGGPLWGNIAYGSKVPFSAPGNPFRSTPLSGHRPGLSACLKGANSGLTHRSKQHLYSIITSARASSVGGTSIPSALAVFILMINSKWVGCWKCRS